MPLATAVSCTKPYRCCPSPLPYTVLLQEAFLAAHAPQYKAVSPSELEEVATDIEKVGGGSDAKGAVCGAWGIGEGGRGRGCRGSGVRDLGHWRRWAGAAMRRERWAGLEGLAGAGVQRERWAGLGELEKVGGASDVQGAVGEAWGIGEGGRGQRCAGSGGRGLGN